MTPSNAIALSLLVPGLPHAMQGRAAVGAAAFVLSAGMFFAGYAILGDRLFHVILFEPFDQIALAFQVLPLNLLPEVGNLGCSIVANRLRDLPEGPALLNEALRQVRVPRPMEHLGFWLTGSSGIVACLFAADAHSHALGHPPRPVNRAFAAGVSFLVPGAGHWLAGQKGKALLMGGAVVLMFAMGLAFSAGTGVDRAVHPAYWITQSLFGGGTLIAALGLGQLPVPNPIPFFYSLGFTLAGVAGLMNLVVMVDAYTVVDRGGAR